MDIVNFYINSVNFWKIRGMRFSKYLVKPIIQNNPISVQILGLCSALAVTQAVLPALVMSAAVICVLAFSNVIISLLRHVMPSSIRLILETTTIASAVIVIDEIIKTFAPDMSQILSVFVALIVTNCIILGRAESFASISGPVASLLDGIGNGIGYSLLLIFVAAVREIIGRGTLLGEVVFLPLSSGGWYLENKFMALPASAFFILGICTWVIKSHLNKTRINQQRD